MKTRFVDRKNRDALIKASEQFKVRDHGKHILKLTYIFLIAIVVLLAVAFFAASSSALRWGIFGAFNEIGAIGSISLMVLVMLALLIYVFAVVKSIKNIINAVEFQNMLFAEALKTGHDFCCVFEKNGNFIYYDENFARLFCKDNNQDGKNDEQLFSTLTNFAGFEKGGAKKLQAAIENLQKVSVSMSFTVEDKEQGQKDAEMTISPIARDSGYFVAKGRFV